MVSNEESSSLSPRLDPENSGRWGPEALDDTLDNRLLSERVGSVLSITNFIPNGVLDKFITPESATQELERDIKDDSGKTEKLKKVEKLVRFVFHRKRPAKKIFAILVCSGFEADKLRKALEDFVDGNLCDGDLPIIRDETPRLPFNRKDGTSWRLQKEHEFLRCQWEFLVPVFSKDVRILDLHQSQILPFTSMDDKNSKAGAFGQVVEVTVHEAHEPDPGLTADGSRVNSALKKIRSDYLPADWEREVDTHEKLSTIDHDHIVEFKAAITKGSERYLLFRWADGGDLRDFWDKNPKTILKAELVEDVIVQLGGLIDGLSALHRFGDGAYRHGDLKPENILRVRTKPWDDASMDVGILKISDLGLAKHHTVATGRRDPTSMLYTTHRYQAPEVHTNKIGGGRSRRYDIWSMGCVILEFVIWLLYGTDELNSFNERIHIVVGEKRQASHFYAIDKSGIPVLHPAVTKAMDAIQKDQECQPSRNTAIRRLLSIVRKRLLVVDLGGVPSFNEKVGSVVVTDMDATIPPAWALPAHARATAEELNEALKIIITECRDKNSELCWYSGLNRDRISGMQIMTDKSSGDGLLTVPSRSLPTREKKELGPDRNAGRNSSKFSNVRR